MDVSESAKSNLASYLVVHDIDQTTTGLIAHLLSVALSTPIFGAKSYLRLDVVTLGNFDLDFASAAEVVSEGSLFVKFDHSKHLERSLGVVSLTGCDEEVLFDSGLQGKKIPIVSLSDFSHIVGNENFINSGKSLFNKVSTRANDVALSYKKNISQRLETGNESIFIADCVFGFCKFLIQNTSRNSESVFL